MSINIITVCFQAEQVLEKTIQSVLSQTHQAQYLILDGASTDKSPQIIQKYAPNLFYWHSKPDKGIYDAMNQAIKLATSEWICFLNAGDIFVDNQVLEKVSQQNADVIYGNYIITYNIYQKYKKVPAPENLTELLNGMCLNHQSVFIRKSVLEKYNFSTEFRLAADYEQILRIFLGKHSFSYLNTPIACFADGGASSVRKIEYLNQCQAILKKYCPELDKDEHFEKLKQQTNKVQQIKKIVPFWLFEALMWVKNRGK